MPTRTITSRVTFAQRFSLRGIDGEFQPGTYVTETSEELVEPLSFVAYRRISTSIQLPGRPGCVETHIIDPEALEAALAKDTSRVDPVTLIDAGISSYLRLPLRTLQRAQEDRERRLDDVAPAVLDHEARRNP